MSKRVETSPIQQIKQPSREMFFHFPYPVALLSGDERGAYAQGKISFRVTAAFERRFEEIGIQRNATRDNVYVYEKYQSGLGIVGFVQIGNKDPFPVICLSRIPEIWLPNAIRWLMQNRVIHSEEAQKWEQKYTGLYEARHAAKIGTDKLFEILHMRAACPFLKTSKDMKHDLIETMWRWADIVKIKGDGGTRLYFAQEKETGDLIAGLELTDRDTRLPLRVPLVSRSPFKSWMGINTKELHLLTDYYIEAGVLQPSQAQLIKTKFQRYKLPRRLGEPIIKKPTGQVVEPSGSRNMEFELNTLLQRTFDENSLKNIPNLSAEYLVTAYTTKGGRLIYKINLSQLTNLIDLKKRQVLHTLHISIDSLKKVNLSSDFPAAIPNLVTLPSGEFTLEYVMVDRFKEKEIKEEQLRQIVWLLHRFESDLPKKS